MNKLEQRNDQAPGDAIPPSHTEDAVELERLVGEGERLRQRSRELVAHGRELAKHSKHLHDEMREVWEARPRVRHGGPDDPPIRGEPDR